MEVCETCCAMPACKRVGFEKMVRGVVESYLMLEHIVNKKSLYKILDEGLESIMECVAEGCPENTPDRSVRVAVPVSIVRVSLDLQLTNPPRVDKIVKREEG